MLGPFARRAIRRAYVEGVFDAAQFDTPSPGEYGEPGANPRVCRAMDRARRAGFHDARNGTPCRPYEFDAQVYTA